MKNVNSSGIGFLGLLTIMLVGFKILGFIDWSWWLVWLPVYIAPLIVMGVGIVGLILTLFVFLATSYSDYRYKQRMIKARQAGK